MTLDFFNTLVFHREGRGRGHVLMEYLEGHGLQPAPWEHDVLYDVFALHDRAYSPTASRRDRRAYYVELAGRVFDRMRIPAPRTAAAEHADALWQILGPTCFDVFPDALDALQALRARGIPLAVVSNWQSGLRHFCSELGLADYFVQVLASADVGFEKPDGRIFLEACERLGVRPERTLHVGDTYDDDYVGGEAAGLQVILIDRAGNADPDATRTVRSLSHLSDVVIEPAPAESEGVAVEADGVPSFGERRPGRDYVRRPSSYVIIRDPERRIAAVRTPLGLFLPGGGIEPGETPTEAALREVSEECGLRVAVLHVIGVANEYVHAEAESAFFRKESSFMRASALGATSPTEADHELVWLSQGEAETGLTYHSHRWAVARDSG